MCSAFHVCRLQKVIATATILFAANVTAASIINSHSPSYILSYHYSTYNIKAYLNNNHCLHGYK